MELHSTPSLQGQPSNEDIISLCLNADTSWGLKYISSHHGWTAWIRHGPHITIYAARTQLYAHRHADLDLMHVPRIYHTFEHEGVGYIPMEYIAHAVTLAEYMRSTSRPDETYTLVADTVRHMTHFAVPKNAAPRPVEGGSLRYLRVSSGLGEGVERCLGVGGVCERGFAAREKNSRYDPTKLSSQPWRVDFNHPILFHSVDILFYRSPFGQYPH